MGFKSVELCSTSANCRGQIRQFNVINVASKHSVFYTILREKAVNLNEKRIFMNLDDMIGRAPDSRFAQGKEEE